MVKTSRMISPVRVYDVAVVLVFGNIDTNVDHEFPSVCVLDAAGATVPLALVTSFYINRLPGI